MLVGWGNSMGKQLVRQVPLNLQPAAATNGTEGGRAPGRTVVLRGLLKVSQIGIDVCGMRWVRGQRDAAVSTLQRNVSAWSRMCNAAAMHPARGSSAFPRPRPHLQWCRTHQHRPRARGCRGRSAGDGAAGQHKGGQQLGNGTGWVEWLGSRPARHRQTGTHKATPQWTTVPAGSHALLAPPARAPGASPPAAAGPACAPPPPGRASRAAPSRGRPSPGGEGQEGRDEGMPQLAGSWWDHHAEAVHACLLTCWLACQQQQATSSACSSKPQHDDTCRMAVHPPLNRNPDWPLAHLGQHERLLKPHHGRRRAALLQQPLAVLESLEARTEEGDTNIRMALAGATAAAASG